MADPQETARRLTELMGSMGSTTAAGAGWVAGKAEENQDYQIRNIGGAPIVYIRTWSSTAWDPETETQGAFIWEQADSGIQDRVLGRIPSTSSGDGSTSSGDTITDPALYRLQQQQTFDINASKEARAAEMQPYDIARSESTVRYQDTEAEIAQKNLERELLSDKFNRAKDAFESSRLAESLANEKKKTATTLLSSIVDNLVPPGQEFLPGLEPGRSLAFPQGAAPPRVAQVNWNQLGPGLEPGTDQALQYLLGLQQQNQGV